VAMLEGFSWPAVVKVLVTSSSTILYEWRFYVAECCCAVWLSAFSRLDSMFLATQFDSKLTDSYHSDVR
jgi:hypothetical protein